MSATKKVRLSRKIFDRVKCLLFKVAILQKHQVSVAPCILRDSQQLKRLISSSLCQMYKCMKELTIRCAKTMDSNFLHLVNWTFVRGFTIQSVKKKQALDIMHK